MREIFGHSVKANTAVIDAERNSIEIMRSTVTI
jgi:hypothetical protein